MDDRSTATANRRVSTTAIARTGERMVRQIEELVGDVVTLRRENDALRVELHHAVVMLERASAALGTHRVPSAAGNGTERRRGLGKSKGPKGRATPAEVTGDVVRAVVAKLGPSTASEVADEITRAGVPVSGRAVRFIAERAGAATVVGDDGKRRYRVD